jgi:hypothetical protein
MWQDMKTAWDWVIVPLLLIGLIWVPWGTLSRWAKEDMRPKKEVL